MRLHFMRIESISIFPHRENRKVVRTWRSLLKDVIAKIAVVFAACLSQALEQNLRFVFSLRRHVDMRHHRDGSTASRPRPGIHGQPLVYTLIVRTVVDRFEFGSKLSRVRGLLMRLEGRLILPKFQVHEVAWPARLLDEIRT